MRFRCLPRTLLFAVACAAPVAVGAAEAGAQQPSAEAYEVLQRLGLLESAAPATPAPASAASDAPAASAYSVLQRLGLLQEDAAASPSAAAIAPAAQPASTAADSAIAPVQAVSVAAAAEPAPAHPQSAAAAAVEAPAFASAGLSLPSPADPLSRAYEMLRAKGLLPGGPVTAPVHAREPRRRSGAERVLVDKSERKLFLFKGGRPYREYRISLGAMPKGPKQRAGDLRTPEGVYTLDWRNPRSRYYKSIHISYPNEEDRVRAAQQGVDPGGNIMIHGEHYSPALQRTLRRASTPKDWTEGCIAMNNEHIDEIWREVADGTPIEIRP